MNQVWVFFKLIEVVLGALCMFIHMRGASLWPQYVPHDVIYCAVFLSFTALAALGAFRLLITQKCVLSAQLILTLSAMIAHYFCGLLVMRDIVNSPILKALNDTSEYMDHPAFAICKQQSIAALVTGTMYLMHMFHVLDLLMRMEPGDWRRQATGLFQMFTLDELAGRTTGLFVLSQPVDDFLCDRCEFYDTLAHSQPMHFRQNYEEETQFINRMWSVFGEARRKFCLTDTFDNSDESYMSTPTITSSDSFELQLSRDDWSMEDEALRYPIDWRGVSDSSSLWAQIEDRSSQATASTTRSTAERSNNWELDDQRKSEIMLVNEGATRRSIWDEEDNYEKSNIWTVKQSSTNRPSTPDSESSEESDEEYYEMENVQLGSTKRDSASETEAPLDPFGFDKDSQNTPTNNPTKTQKSAK
ncbi:uncharacterized protein [Drosophila bipectinata]|uniref:uncharacterized protein n=1 Tax=Drosophila bipectinata TaxID=42026 RepID=UPI0038B3C1D6